MSDADPLRPPYLRRVTFLDTVPDNGTDFPVHVASELLLDGQPHPGLYVPDRGWGVFSEHADSPSVVTFCVPAERAELGRVVTEPDGLQLIDGMALDGVPVLTPSDHPWQVLKSRGPDVVRVFVLVREVTVTAAEQRYGIPA